MEFVQKLEISSDNRLSLKAMKFAGGKAYVTPRFHGEPVEEWDCFLKVGMFSTL
jgi:hypothetical protein